ncbi:sodium/mannose cotransporter SLC5A10-like [Argiope bruennichi]|uniref:Sodium/glucose cotransporter 1 like protein n=1 Tax=Argiope bruennichi TaxID=94029 RepID=A0A8T0EAG5_ARGBR|nr:sodium/mannose cotransporter SLC5A10-like [Argiope bruennichi]KAF8768377.1 Sodium/glucose cotransporter 1 like protein [Argiope bruennichi]
MADEKLGSTELYWEDAVVIALYFIMVLAVGVWSSWRSKRNSISGYFLASRSMHWIPVGASLFASNIGSGHFIGLTGSGASSGIGIAGFELNAMFAVLILGWFFVPVYMASGVYTMPEYLRKRFGGQRIRIYLSVLALLLYIFTKISADLYAGAIFINQSIKLNLYASVLTLLAVAALFTIAGGLSAVIWTDFVQTILMLLGAMVLAVKSISKVGGYSKLVKDFGDIPINDSFIGYNDRNESCSAVPENYMSLLRSPSDTELPITGMTFGLTISAIWYWCSDQVIVQRVLSAKDLSHAKGGCVLAGYLKILPLFLLVLPGMASRILFPNEVACSNPDACEAICGSRLGCTNIAYPKLVLTLMPAGARGLMISVMLAALMSSLTSIFNSSSTIFTMDIWRRIRKEATETELLIVGKIFVLLLVGISIVWIPIIQESQNSQLFHYIQSVTSFLAPPVCAVYILAIAFKRVNEQGAFWGLMVGLLVGMIRFIWEFSYKVPSCASQLPDPRPAIISKVHYLHFGIILFIISCIVTIAVSYATQPIAKMHLHRLTFWNRHSKDVRIEITKKKILPSSENNVAEMGQVNAAFREGDHQKDSSADVENGDHKYGLTEKETHLGPPIYVLDVVNKFKEDTEFPEKSLSEGMAQEPNWKKALYFLCGVSSDSRDTESQQEFTAEEEANLAAESIEEKPIWRRICNANALLLLAVCSFMWGYYA